MLFTIHTFYNFRFLIFYLLHSDFYCFALLRVLLIPNHVFVITTLVIDIFHSVLYFYFLVHLYTFLFLHLFLEAFVLFRVYQFFFIQCFIDKIFVLHLESSFIPNVNQLRIFYFIITFDNYLFSYCFIIVIVEVLKYFAFWYWYHCDLFQLTPFNSQ